MRRMLKGFSILLLGMVLIITSSAGTYAGIGQEGTARGVDEPQSPGISVRLQRDEVSYKPGETLEYNTMVTNTGNLDLRDLKLDDLLLGEKTIESLKVGEELILQGSYEIPMDVEDEFITNRVTVTGEASGVKVEASDSFEAYMEVFSSIEDASEEPAPEDKTKEEEEYSEMKGQSETKESMDQDELAENYPPMRGEPPIKYKRSMGLMSIPTIEDTIMVDKTAKRYKPGCRTFEVTLDITGEPQNIPVDVVLIIDRSGSMNQGVVDEYVPINTPPSNNGNYFVKIGETYQSITMSSGTGANSIWRYGKSPNRRYVKWNSNGDDNAPGGTSSGNAVGKPFYEKFGRSRLYYAKQAAANFAEKVLGVTGIPGSRVSIVSFAGPATTSGHGSQTQASTDIGLSSNLIDVNNAIAGITAVGGTNTQAGFIQGSSVIEKSDNPNSNKIVIMFTDGLPTASNGNKYAVTTDRNHIHVIKTLEAGKGIYENNIADVFTVGLLEGMTTNERDLALYILKGTQNRGWYEAPTAQDLDRIFNDISQKLSYSAKDAKVVDKIGDNFNLIESSLPEGATYNPEKREITWKSGTIVERSQLTYILQAKPEFDEGMAYTNEYATLNYTDASGITNKTKDFPRPEVNVPAKLKVSLTDATITLGDTIRLGTGMDLDGENYMSPITGGDGDGTYTYEWRIEGKDDVISIEENPAVKPTEDTKYELTVTDSNGCIAVATMMVRVKEPTGSITIKKEVVEPPKDSDKNKMFDIFVYGPDNKIYVVTLKHNESKTISNLPLGAYRVEEIVPMNYELEGITNDGKVELTRENLSDHVTVKNKRTNDGWFHDDDDKQNKFTVATTTAR